MRAEHAMPVHRARGVVAVAAAAVAVLLGAAALRTLDPGSTTTGVRLSPEWSAPLTTADDAIETWVAVHRDEVFAGFTGPYAGSCSTAVLDSLCSALTEDLGRTQIHMIGAYATDNGLDLLLVRDTGGWQVTAWSPWPALGTPSFGPPWSPQTAIAQWWAGRVDAMGLSGAVHVSSCAVAAQVVDTGTGQSILCGTLVTDDGAVRTYRSGRFGVAPDVELVVARQDDETWIVRSTTALDQTTG